MPLKNRFRQINQGEVKSIHNIEIINTSSADQLLDAFDWADIVIVALKPNLHASGITCLQEAALRGVAAICSDTGGLKAYFPDDEVYYVAGGEPSNIQKAIVELSGDDERRWGLAARAQARMKTGKLNSRSYARRHAELSRELLAPKALSSAAADAARPEA